VRLGYEGGGDLAPGTFYAAGIFPAECEADHFAALHFVEGQGKRRARVERGVRQFVDRERPGLADDPADFDAVLSGGFGTAVSFFAVEEVDRQAANLTAVYVEVGIRIKPITDSGSEPGRWGFMP
jgi:hypothetical protein